MLNLFYKLILFYSLLPLISTISSCGAKLKTADKVGGVFSKSQTLTDKIKTLCNQLQNRTQEPSLKNISLSNELCEKPAGLYAQNLNEIEQNQGVGFVVENVIKDVDPKEKVFKLQTKTDIWINKSLAGIIQIILPKINNNAEGLFKNQKTQNTQDQKFTISVIGKPEFNSEQKELKIEFELSSTRAQNGQVDILNKLIAYAKLFDNVAVAKITTTQDAQYKDSILKRINILALATPHASDIYVSIITDFDIYSFGVDYVMEKEIKKTIAQAIKSIPQLIKNIEEDGSN